MRETVQTKIPTMSLSQMELTDTEAFADTLEK